MFSIALPALAPSVGRSGYAQRLIPPQVLGLCDSRKRPRPAPEQVEALVLELLSHDQSYRRQSSRIRRGQGQLKLRVSRATWQVYLLLEEAEVERLSYALDRVAEWALKVTRRPRNR